MDLLNLEHSDLFFDYDYLERFQRYTSKNDNLKKVQRNTSKSVPGPK